MVSTNYLSFLSRISAFILIIAIVNPIEANAKVIIISGISILGSIEGDENLLILAGWWSVFHQSTENLIIGIFIAPKIAIIEDILFDLSWSAKILKDKR